MASQTARPQIDGQPWGASEQALQFLRALGTPRLAEVIIHCRWSEAYWRGQHAAERRMCENPHEGNEHEEIEAEGWEAGYDAMIMGEIGE